MKNVKIKEIKDKVKIIREIKRESEGDKEIRELTKSESAAEMVSAGTGFQPVENGIRPMRAVADVPVRRTSREEATTEAPTAHLYDVGRRMGDDANRPKYKLSENIESGQTLRSVGVGRDFATGAQANGYPEANRIESSLRQEDEKKYSTGMESADGHRKTKRYAWEI